MRAVESAWEARTMTAGPAARTLGSTLAALVLCLSSSASAGGRGAFHELVPPPGSTGHRIVERPELWEALVADYLTRIGLPADVR
jgi:hypothetical protein